MITDYCLGRGLRGWLCYALTPVASLVLQVGTAAVGALSTPLVLAENVRFSDAFLPVDSRTFDIRQFEKGNPVMPGDYHADVVVNGQRVSRQRFRIAAQVDGGDPVVCMERDLLDHLGVDLDRLGRGAAERLDAGEHCLSIAVLIDNASASFSPSEQRLEVSVPQLYLRRAARGHVSHELWDSGVTAGLLSYNLSATRNQGNGRTYDSAYLGLGAGLNLGQWRLRHNGSLSWQGQAGSDYQAINTYLERDVTTLKGQLTLGEANTSGEIFDTLGYLGAQLRSDDRMLPASMRDYAPVVRGIARTSARVVVRQAGNLLLETNVAPGAFAIDDLYATGYGGDLQVTVYEADGTEQRFVVPYAAGARLLRPGAIRYSVTLGQARSNYLMEQPGLLQATVQHGLSNVFTGYAGMQASEGYRSVLAGLAFNTPVGAMAFDLTHARTDLASGSLRGQSARLSYSKNVVSTGSNLSMAAYRFSTDGYLDFRDGVQMLDAQKRGLSSMSYMRPRSRLSANIDQQLGGWGQLTLSGYTQNYWNRPGSDVQYQFGYSKRVGQVDYSLNATRSRSGWAAMDSAVLFSLSMPLDLWRSAHSQRLAMSVGRDRAGKYDEQLSLTGSAGSAREYSYGATVAYSDEQHVKSTSLNAQYTGAKVQLGGGLSRGDDYRSLSLSASGSVVAHPKGVTLSPYSGETLAVVSAPGAQGARLVGYPNLRLDSSGNAILPYLRPYELNEVAIDPNGAPLDIELSETGRQVSPRAGAVVALSYEVNKGEALLLDVQLGGGELVPFGAQVLDADGRTVGIVGQGGQAYVRLAEGVRDLRIQWGRQAERRCNLRVPAGGREGRPFRRVQVTCELLVASLESKRPANSPSELQH